ncbi:hypothetical protein [Microbacterium arborescens]|uniref:hypothetical protein n=1 Tax=Microbacterium arborescens TaxID=33883 RepID=UPI0013B3FF59|nr:hypothetical protein [Microbacterium arborescens]
MNRQLVEMAWIAAVLAPWTVSPHPNFSGGEVTAPQALALITERRNSHVEQEQSDRSLAWSDWAPELLDAAQASLAAATQFEATASLWDIAQRSDLPVGARVAAATYAALGSLELDQAFESVDRLGALAAELTEATTPDEWEPSYRLAVAVLQQQRVVRACDSLRFDDARASIIEVNRWLPNMTATGYEDFPVSKGISWGAARVQRDILSATKQNALAARAIIEKFGGRGWVRVVRARSGWIDLRQYVLERNRGAAVVRDEFETRFESTSGKRVLGRESATDVAYNALLVAELSGDLAVARANRAEMAKIHLLARDDVEFRAREALRLLRQSNETGPLKAALAWIRAEGPLAALEGDASKILVRAVRDRYASESDLLVLASAADTLDSSDLAKSISVAHIYLETLERTNGYSWPHLDNVWKAIARFLPGSERDDQVARSASEILHEPKLLSRPLSNTLARVVAVIDWAQVEAEVRDTWSQWLERQSPTDPETEALVFQVRGALKLPDLELELPVGIESAAILADGGLPPDAVESRISDARDAIISALRTEANDAARGTFSFGRIAPSNVGVAFALRFGDQILWDAVVEHLVDPNIVADFKESALDRLASNASDVPASVRERLSDNWRTIAASRRDSWFGGENLPLAPEALRMAAAFRALTPTEGLEAVLELNGSGDVGRMEAARSIPLVVARDDATWAHVLLLQLSEDPNPDVRAEAGFAMIQLLSADSFASDMVVQRARALLQSDGIRCALRVLHGLQSLVDAGSQAVMPWLPLAREMAKSDSRRIIRGAATELLRMAEG